ncbi:MAG: phosphate acyltransferase PlsX [Dehalococcoidales bacterium]|jgi:glycerol-3-phosphate acyltransferase PlsX|nr:phosphate acyltransferase PlsX [Dehalococcoidales bacterium]MDP7285596.1 phosphate acyltransferase PlsX [Dehalococcoidales bacterium]MDP7415380.1 phosphate acyltransferase PlsX [Dehalococcoidales bacterium]
MIIAVDAAGGDYAPHEVVKGALKAVQEYEVEVKLVGRKNVLHVLLGRQLRKSGLTIVNASQVIGSHESPVKAIRGKPNSSIVVGVNLVKEGKASSFISAGNTGAVLGAALFGLGKVAGIERPAIACIMDITPSTPVLLIDAGANVDCRPNHLVQFAEMGAVYCQRVLGVKSPRIGLLSVGEEENKGNQLVQETHPLLKSNKKLNFIGNVEGHDILKATADVVVTDGFTGNIVLKTIEGMSDTFLSSTRQIGHLISNVYHFRGRDLLRDVGLGSWVNRIDYQEHGGACLLGVNGNIIIAHGRSRAKTIKNAIGIAKHMANHNISQVIKEEIRE